jgi:hypothetical protein
VKESIKERGRIRKANKKAGKGKPVLIRDTVFNPGFFFNLFAFNDLSF